MAKPKSKPDELDVVISGLAPKPEPVPPKPEPGVLEITLPLIKDMKLCYAEMADLVRSKGFSENKMDCKVLVKLVVDGGVDPKNDGGMFHRIVSNYFKNGLSITTETKQ